MERIDTMSDTNNQILLSQKDKQELLNLIHEKNKITLKEDDPLLILLTAFDFILDKTNNSLQLSLNNLIDEFQQYSVDASQELTTKLNIQFTDEMQDSVYQFMQSIYDERGKEVKDLEKNLDITKTQLYALQKNISNQLTQAKNLVWFNLISALIIAFSLVFFTFFSGQ